jgi:hypothetical protein
VPDSIFEDAETRLKLGAVMGMAGRLETPQYARSLHLQTVELGFAQ